MLDHKFRGFRNNCRNIRLSPHHLKLQLLRAVLGSHFLKDCCLYIGILKVSDARQLLRLILQPSDHVVRDLCNLLFFWRMERGLLIGRREFCAVRRVFGPKAQLGCKLSLGDYGNQLLLQLTRVQDNLLQANS